MTLMNLIEFLQQPLPEFSTLKFRFAKTMPDSPHAYAVWSPENRDDYAKLSQLIEKEGSLEEWKDGRRHRYLTIGPFRYWHMQPVINRAKA